MRACREAQFALGGLALLAGWLFVGLPLLYSPGESQHGELLGVKYGEWLLFLATMALWYATRQLVIGAEATAERQLRAYVMIESVRIEGLEVGQCPRAVVKIKNSGSTPARNVTQWAKLVYTSFPNMSQMPTRDAATQLFPSALAPGGVLNVSSGLDKPMLTGIISALASGQYAFYLVGEIRYVDAFDKARETDFVLFSTGPLLAGGTMATHQTGNRIT